MNLGALRGEYQDLQLSAERLRLALLHEMESLLGTATLAVPIESRVKSWESIEERLKRKPIDLAKLSDLDDLVGLRIILLFRRDLEEALSKIKLTFDVVSIEDKASTLAHEQFGYQSHHYVVRMPDNWLSVPSLAGLGDLKAEIQIRTMAQHIWAAASHKLQYKQQESVPPPLMRTIYRVSALLETVDLEFERVLDQRGTYAEEIVKVSSDEVLNVDLLVSILKEMLPVDNFIAEHEEFAEILGDLAYFNVRTASELRELLRETKPKILEADAARALQERKLKPDNPRYSKGVFFSWSGLVRNALDCRFGEEIVTKYLIEKYSSNQESPRNSQGN